MIVSIHVGLKVSWYDVATMEVFTSYKTTIAMSAYHITFKVPRERESTKCNVWCLGWYNWVI